MRYLLDSDIVIDYLKGRQDAVQLVRTLAPDGLAISLITYGELYEGVYYGTLQREHERGLLAFLHTAIVLPLNRTIMKRFARIRGQLRRAGNLISDPDLLIGATALQHSLTLVTRNRQHFQRIPNLTLYQPASGS